MGLNKLEVKILKSINNSGYKGKSAIIRYLMDTLVLPNDLAKKYYALWFLNYRKDGKYEEIEEPNTDIDAFLNILKRVQSGDLEVDDIPERFYGESLPECRSSGFGYGRYKSNTPCVELSEDTVYLSLDRDTWEKEGIGGIHEEDLWKFYESFYSYGGDYIEHFDSDEFDYFSYDEETLVLIKKIAILAKRKDVVDYIDENISRLETEKLAEYLEEMLPKDVFDYIVRDYMYDINNITSDIRMKAVQEYYNEEIKYAVSRDGDTFDMEIPIEDFIEIVELENLLSFSDVIDEDVEIQPIIDLESVYYDTGYYNSDDNSHIEGLNRNLESFLDKFDDPETGLSDYFDKQKQFDDILNNTGLKYMNTDWRGNKQYTTPDARLHLNSGDIDFYKGKITFTYDGEKHTIPLDNFMNWAQGSVLDLKYESVRYGKIPLMEGKKTITKISIFDFDGTLADTPSKEDGIPIWEAKMKQEYPHLGWYSKRESLDENVFNIKLIQTTVRDYAIESRNENTLVVMLTGRMPNQADQVENILSRNGVVFEEYHYKERGDTFTSKINTIKKLLSQNPQVTEIEMWEDRENHADGFEEWGLKNGVNIRVNRVSI